MKSFSLLVVLETVVTGHYWVREVLKELDTIIIHSHLGEKNTL